MKNKWYPLILGSLFLILTIVVVFDLTESFDTFCYKIITTWQNDSLTTVLKTITFLGSTLFITLLTIFFTIFFILKKDNKKALIVSSLVIISTIINNVIKVIIRRNRPLVLALVKETSFSYPSGHMMASVSLYGILLYFVLKSNWQKSIKILISGVLILIPLLVGLSRIYLGAHFASDVIGALLCSSCLISVYVNFIAKYKWL